MLAVLEPFGAFEAFRAPRATGAGWITQPIVLTSPLGVVFTNSDGAVLTRGTRRVRRLTPETSPVVEFASADGAYFASADGVIFSASGAGDGVTLTATNVGDAIDELAGLIAAL